MSYRTFRPVWMFDIKLSVWAECSAWTECSTFRPFFATLSPRYDPTMCSLREPRRLIANEVHISNVVRMYASSVNMPVLAHYGMLASVHGIYTKWMCPKSARCRPCKHARTVPVLGRCWQYRPSSGT